MAEFERDDFEITPELLANFSDDSFYGYGYETDEKTIEQIREERYRRQEQRRIRRKKERIANIKNYLMPTAALALLVSTVCYMNSLQFGLVVSYNNEQLGVVENAAVVEEATNIIDSRIINKSLDSLEDEPQYKVAVITNKSDLSNSSEISSRIIARDGTLEDELCGVFVDDDFIGAVASEEDVKAVLDGLIDAKKNQSKDLGDVKKVEFNSSVVSEVGLYAKDSVIDKAELKKRLTENVDISYKITVLQEQNVKIKYKTEYVEDATKPAGFEQVTTKGVIGEGVATNESVYIDGEKISSEHVKVTATKKPVNEVIAVSSESKYLKSSDEDTEEASDADSDKDSDTSTDTDTATDSDSDTDTDTDTSTDTDAQTETEQPKSDAPFVWPAQGYITGVFGYEGESFHKGMDIGAGYGAPVVAAADGVVVNVVFDYGTEGLGCYAVVDHGNGYQTMYAQCSDIYVTVGQTVSQGELIAAVGSTGDSTGPHLHFRVTYYGEYQDPAFFLY